MTKGPPQETLKKQHDPRFRCLPINIGPPQSILEFVLHRSRNVCFAFGFVRPSGLNLHVSLLVASRTTGVSQSAVSWCVPS